MDVVLLQLNPHTSPRMNMSNMICTMTSSLVPDEEFHLRMVCVKDNYCSILITRVMPSFGVFATSLSLLVVVITIFCRFWMVSCEHYNSINNQCHFLDYAPSKGSLDCDCLEALFYQDTNEIAHIESMASD